MGRNKEKCIMEEWRDIPGFEGLYQVSISTKEGRCRRLYKNGNIKELSNTPHKSNGRIYWVLSKDGKFTNKQAARWIAITYPELVQNEYFDGAEIDHIIPLSLGGSNHPSNLRWVTRKDNINNPLTIKNMQKQKSDKHREHISESLKGKHLNRPDQSKWVIKLSLNNEILHFYPSTHQAQRETGIDDSSIRKCCNGKQKSAGGFTWKYAD